MRTFDPCLIKRIGIAVEMADGEQIMFYTESPGTEIQIENRNETQQVFVGNITRTLITDSTTETNTPTPSISERHSMVGTPITPRDSSRNIRTARSELLTNMASSTQSKMRTPNDLPH